MNKVGFLFLLILFSFSSFGQNTDEELAAQYYSEGEFEKAEFLYKKLLKNNPKSVYIYDNFLTSLIKQKKFSEAEKMVSKKARKASTNVLYKVDIGYLKKLQGQNDAAEKVFLRLIQGPELDDIEALAGAFRKRKLSNLAEQAYLESRDNLRLPYLYGSELLSLYSGEANFIKTIDECLNQLNYKSMRLSDVKGFLFPVVDGKKDLPYLQKQTLLFIQKHPENRAFDELLYWVFTQQKKFNSAFRQSAAMDKRRLNDGSSLLTLADLCISNKEFDVAIKCFNYVIDLGKNKPNFVKGKMGLLETSYAKLTEGYSMTDTEVNSLIQNYTEFIGLYGKSWTTATSMKELADIYIFYSHDLDKGIAMLEDVKNIPRLQPKMLGDVKLSLGDAYLMKNDLWEATLIYGQVDKAFKEDPLGQEAKFRNALLSYFKGDFEWATTQLDVLKTATTQLISNNAIELALRIQDNIGLDSTTDALKEFAQAELLLKQNRLEESLSALDKLPFKYPNHALEDEIYFIKAQVFEKQKDFESAQKFYESVFNLFPDDILADNALYRLAKMFELKTNEPTKALAMYEKLVLEHTGSLFHVEARKAYNRLKASTTGVNP